MSSALPQLPRRGLMRGMPLLARNTRRLACIKRWAICVVLVLAVLIAGRMEMDDAIVAEQMRNDLARAVATLEADKAKPKCEPLDRRKAHSAERVARQCVEGGAP